MSAAVTTNGAAATNGVEKPEVPRDSLTVTDNRTGAIYQIPIKRNAIRATDFKAMKAPPTESDSPADNHEQGLRVFDPGYVNTAVSESKVTYADGNKGTIQYRGYSITDLVGKKGWEDTAHLLIWGSFPSPEERSSFKKKLATYPLPAQSVFDIINAFPADSPPISMLMGGMTAVHAADPKAVPACVARNIYLGNLKAVDEQIVRTLSHFAVVLAAIYCRTKGRKFTNPRPDFSYVENLLLMMGHVDEETGVPNPKHVEYMERLWILVADHEMTNSTAAFLHAASALNDPAACVITALGSANGILHGGAIEVAYKDIFSIKTVEDVPAKFEAVKSGKQRLYGYGHRIYKTIDPRYLFIKEMLDEVQESVKDNHVLNIAMEIDRIASTDEYFTSRKLKANADLFASYVYIAL